jgi:hypothetical protein
VLRFGSTLTNNIIEGVYEKSADGSTESKKGWNKRRDKFKN